MSFLRGMFWLVRGRSKFVLNVKDAWFLNTCPRENSLLSVCDQLSLASLHSVTTKKQERPHTHTTWPFALPLRKAPTSTALKWRNGHSSSCSVTHTSLHTRTTGPEKGWGWWQSLSVCWCQSLQRTEAEWHRVASGDTQPVIKKWQRWPIFLPSQSSPNFNTCSNFLHLVSLESILVSFSPATF